ncbi:hypothetical protein ACWN8V_10315 [Vagococcus elongatus]|uniref:Uncharacterized protein n=1 Tax=Vagococcus elongatus TaxID=180344 RepID=A0A430APU4_9ENTE|nr:hypothetical protein [Vagococcus elongatus]RSU10142.1 hypothetical protein CBF29_10160 [Vagococcus elongatus]
MEETIFFNLGNALASKKDTKELMRTAQVEYDKRKGKLIIVEDSENGELVLFDLSDSEHPSEKTRKYFVKKVIE